MFPVAQNQLTKVNQKPPCRDQNGIPLVPIERVGGATIFTAMNHNISSTGAAWLLPDRGPLLQLEKEVMRGGVYDMSADRTRRKVFIPISSPIVC